MRFKTLSHLLFLFWYAYFAGCFRCRRRCRCRVRLRGRAHRSAQQKIKKKNMRNRNEYYRFWVEKILGFGSYALQALFDKFLWLFHSEGFKVLLIWAWLHAREESGLLWLGVCELIRPTSMWILNFLVLWFTVFSDRQSQSPMIFFFSHSFWNGISKQKKKKKNWPTAK